ncbi:VOC family protein [Streptomyces indicus]|uniref:VOC domain-containing protein n=1 Tax=Streptomyces indicus TaxID=417292 RepID=A0A1G9EIT5_9ACTN|nr:VOC family protein [Streptomyces indicus]SDK76034.1 hypothetical protein SAMN05421806_111198 [Streptomyces indicus]
MSLELLGLDNVLLPVGDLAEAVDFYERAGFPLAFRLDEAGIAGLKVGTETPGVLLRQEDGLPHRPAGEWSPRLWIEVPDARKAAVELTSAGVVPGAPFSVSTGWTVELADPWGNILGFTDYLKRPSLARATATAGEHEPDREREPTAR